MRRRDLFEQHGRRLVGKVLRDELAAERLLEDRAAEGGASAKRSIDPGAHSLRNGKLSLNLRDGALLLVQRRCRYGKRLERREVEGGQVRCLTAVLFEPASPKGVPVPRHELRIKPFPVSRC